CLLMASTGHDFHRSGCSWFIGGFEGLGPRSPFAVRAGLLLMPRSLDYLIACGIDSFPILVRH
ncbi:MAG: hypothetical protein ACLQIB_30680, partial [Isosphaeraceae bacterium]